MRPAQERTCAECGQPLPHQERSHGRPMQYCSTCRLRRRKLSYVNQRARQQGTLSGQDRAVFADEQLALASQAFADLPTVAKAMLQYWISRAIAPAASLEPRDADRLRKDFSSEVGLISLHQFAGAMIDAGYEPIATKDGRLLFAIQRGNDVSSPDEPAWRYTLGHPTPRFRQLDIQLQEYIDLFGPLTTEVVEDDNEDVAE